MSSDFIGLGLFVSSLIASSRWFSLTQSNDNNNNNNVLLSHSEHHSVVAAINSTQKIYKIVITGGPCSGKTTAMERLQVFLRERGFRVFVCQEAATILLLNGASFDDFKSPESSYAFQQFVIGTQMSFEDQFTNYARKTNQDCVILCDRGLMDGSAYMSNESWLRLLDEVHLDPISARDARYDAVFHLVTAADGASKFYTLENNFARKESPEEAIQVDKRTQAVWAGHPRHIIVDNRNGRSFESKLQYLVSALAAQVGLPSVGRKARKYPVLVKPDISKIPNVQIFDVEKVMLLSSEDTSGNDSKASASTSTQSLDSLAKAAAGKEIYRFIRRRSQGGFSSYGLTTVRQLDSGEKVELKQVISSAMYRVLKSTAIDTTRNIVTQRRYCFLWEQQSFHLYEYLSPRAGLMVLLVQSEGTPSLPPFLSLGPEASSDDQQLAAYSISRKDSGNL